MHHKPPKHGSIPGTFGATPTEVAVKCPVEMPQPRETAGNTGEITPNWLAPTGGGRCDASHEYLGCCETWGAEKQPFIFFHEHLVNRNVF
jgi:hypothetical protein